MFPFQYVLSSLDYSNTQAFPAAFHLISLSSGPRFHLKVYPALRVPKRGVDLLNDPLFNKGSSFPKAERDRLGLRGLLPSRRIDMKTQTERVLSNLRKLEDPIMQNQVHLTAFNPHSTPHPLPALWKKPTSSS